MVLPTPVLKRPILVGGLGLAATWCLWQGVGEGLGDLWWLEGLTLGAGWWWWQSRPRSQPPTSSVKAPADRDAVLAALTALEAKIAHLEAKGGETEASAIAPLRDGVASLRQSLGRSSLRLAVLGERRSGKTTILGALATLTSHQNPPLNPGLNTPLQGREWVGDDLPSLSPLEDWHHPLGDQDGVLYVVTEDLTESAYQRLKTLAAAGYPIALVLNQCDRLPPATLAQVEAQLQRRGKELTIPVLTTAIAPSPRKVRRHHGDGQIEESWTQPTPEVAALATWLTDWQTNGEHWIIQTTHRQGMALGRQVQIALNQVYRTQAQPLVESMQWAAAATALASPFPTVDLLVAGAINGQLMVDLAALYGQPLSLSQAQAVAQELAGLLVKLGVVEASTQLLATVLKSYGVTYLVGGAVQGLSAAYLTHGVAAGFMEVLEARALAGETGAPLTAAAIAAGIQGWLQRVPQREFLVGLIQQGQTRYQALAGAVTEGQAQAMGSGV